MTSICLNICMYDIYVCVYVYKLGPWELKLKVVVNHPMWALGTDLGLAAKPSSSPCFFF